MKLFVLDEVDRMLDMGHMPDLRTIFTHLPKAYNPKSTAPGRDRNHSMQVRSPSRGR